MNNLSLTFRTAAASALLMSAAGAAEAATFTGVAVDSVTAIESFTPTTASWVWSMDDSDLTSAFSLTSATSFNISLDFYAPTGDQSLFTLVQSGAGGTSIPLGSVVADDTLLPRILFADVAAGDYLLVLSDGGQDTGNIQVSLASQVPAPASALLLGSAMGVFGLRSRLKSRRA